LARNSGDTSNVETFETDIVIVGGGGSGLSAAVAAAEKGARIVLLEKRPTAGGNAAFARGMFAAESCVQKRLNIDARRDELFKLAMDYSHWKIDPQIIRAFVDKSGDTIQWLEEKGLKFDDVLHYYPNQVPRVFHVPEGQGVALVKVLVKRCEDLGVRFYYETSPKRILTSDNGNIVGILAASKQGGLSINAKGVIIATGGYSGNKELLKKYYPFYTENLFSDGLPNMGDGLLMATEIGGATEGLGILQLGGPRFPGSWYINTVAVEPKTIWINKKAERFIDESKAFYWPEAGNALNRQPDKISYTLFDEKIKQSFIEGGVIKGNHRFPPMTRLIELGKELKLQADKGKVKISDSWEEIAGWIGAVPKVLKVTIEEYNSFCEQRCDQIFAKDPRFLLPLRHPPYYALKCFQSFLTTIGGIKINHHMEVLNHQDTPIPGLYAAGNDTGGWESDTYCIILSGNAFSFAINSGRIAGENAAKYISGK
jgi:fumarate reductase flavoprotein subunit